LEALAALTDLIVRGTSAAALFQGSRTRWDSRDVQHFELDMEGEQGTFRYALDINHSQERAQAVTIRSEVVTCDGETIYRFSDGQVHWAGEQGRATADFPFQSNQSFLANVDTRAGRLGEFKRFLARTRLLQPNPFGMEKTTREELPLLARNCGNFPSYFSFLNDEQPEARSSLEIKLRQVMPGFVRFKLLRRGEEKLMLAEFESQKGPPFEFNLMELSEGQRVLVAMYAALYGMLGLDSLLCFDEPDNFVSLSEVQPWLQELRDALEARGGQAMVVSHHPEVIDYLALDSAWRFERPAGPVIARKLDFGSSPELKPSEIIARGG
jgi:predicted ATPase